MTENWKSGSLVLDDPVFLKIESMTLQTDSNGFKIVLRLCSNPKSKNIKGIAPKFLTMEMNNVNVQFLTLMLGWMKESNDSIERKNLSQLEFKALVFPFVVHT